MPGEFKTLLAQQLRSFDASLERVEAKQDALIGRMTQLEGSIAAMMQHLAQLAAADVAQQVCLDQLGGRTDALERHAQVVRRPVAKGEGQT